MWPYSKKKEETSKITKFHPPALSALEKLEQELEALGDVPPVNPTVLQNKKYKLQVLQCKLLVLLIKKVTLLDNSG